jgi:hypothetical protein
MYTYYANKEGPTIEAYAYIFPMKLVFTCCLIICSFFTLAQAQLPLDETKHVSFIEVVKADSLDEKLLYSNAKAWLLANGYHLTSTASDSLAGKLTATHGFYVYAKGYLTKKIHGKITYNTLLEVKNGRYRYSFNQFVFHYYAEGRTLKTLSTGRQKPLEEQKASGWQTLWESHKRTTAEHIISQIKTMTVAMAEQPKLKPEPVVTKKIPTADW